jgi:hypothetical protein
VPVAVNSSRAVALQKQISPIAHTEQKSNNALTHDKAIISFRNWEHEQLQKAVKLQASKQQEFN